MYKQGLIIVEGNSGGKDKDYLEKSFLNALQCQILFLQYKVIVTWRKMKNHYLKLKKKTFTWSHKGNCILFAWSVKNFQLLKECFLLMERNAAKFNNLFLWNKYV